MPRRTTSPGFVGRTAELADLEAALGRASAGTPAAVLIAGESGVGKTRLVRELSGRARAEGVRVLTGDCIDLGEGELPYAPIVAALRQLVHDLDEGQLDLVFGPARADIAPLLPELAAEDGGHRAQAPDQALLFEQLLAVLGRLADLTPVVLVVEDLHWADRSTREFLAFLLRNARHEPLLLIGTYRAEDLHRRHPLRPFLADADRAPNVDRVELPPLTRVELAQLLAGILGARPGDELVDELFTRAEGNPFFTEELAAAATDGSRRLPDTVRDALLLRVEGLDEPTQQVLRVAAAAGRRVSHGLLAAAADVPEAELRRVLREALAHNVLVQDADGEAYVFRHALLRDVLYEDLLPGERGPLHRALATALSAQPSLSVAAGGPGAELAFHWFSAHDLPAALEASLEAGEQAYGVAAFAEANRHYERALEVWDGVPPERRPAGVTVIDVLRRAAEAAHLAAEIERAAALARRAHSLVDADADPMTAAQLEGLVARYEFLCGRTAHALAAYRSAVARMPAEPATAERAALLGSEGHSLMLAGRLTEGRRRCEEALAVAHEAGAHDQEGPVLATLGFLRFVTGEVDEGVADLRRAGAIAAERDDPELLSRVHINLGELLDQLGRTDEAVEVAMQGRAALNGRRIGLAVLAGDAATRLRRLGRWDEAADVIDEAGALPLTGMAASAILEARGVLAVLRGEFGEAESDLDEADRLLGDLGGTMWQGPTTLARAELALWQQRPQDAAAALAGGLAEHSEEEFVFYLAPMFAMGARAEADLALTARGLGDAAGAHAAAKRAADLHARLRARLDAPFIPPESIRHAELCGLEAARAAGAAEPAAWRALAAGWDELGRPYDAAYARWREAEAALARDADRDMAERALRAAADTAERLGARPLHDEVADLARRARLRLAERSAAADGPATTTADRIGLTPREVEVLRLLAVGHTNREIAEDLFMSHKTASVHVSRILTKLGVRGRVEAAGLANRLGLLAEPVGDEAG